VGREYGKSVFGDASVGRLDYHRFTVRVSWRSLFSAFVKTVWNRVQIAGMSLACFQNIGHIMPFASSGSLTATANIPVRLE